MNRSTKDHIESLKEAVEVYAARHANSDGLAMTPVPGLMMKCVKMPSGGRHSVYRPLVCVILQGAKRMTVGREERVFFAGQSAIVSADMPVTGQIMTASQDEPFLAVAIELEIATLRELAAQLGDVRSHHPSETGNLFAVDTETATLDSIWRLMQLMDRPAAVPLLRPGIMRELHYWLLSGPHGAALRTLADPHSHAGRLAAAIAILRAEYRDRLSIERLAAAAAMSLTAFHKYFKQMTSLTPGQYQKRLRLVEARRLMLDEGLSATSAAFEVGYESVSQFTRDYARLFNAPPKRDTLRLQAASRWISEEMRKGEQANAA
ncbi:AraC family transcriptional regulator [Chelativorans sp. M5D2P16]|uniref:AraC family transcriptional regulator n=1 Tax=Chelativorans sp. M5D2P16 TaxID=3095678 RepID=UPI003A0FD15D